MVRELGSPHPEFLDFTTDEVLGEVTLVEDIPARREVVREVQDAAKAIIEGEQVLYDGVELFTAIMLADEQDAAHRAVRLAEMAASVDQLSRKIACEVAPSPLGLLAEHVSAIEQGISCEDMDALHYDSLRLLQGWDAPLPPRPISSPDPEEEGYGPPWLDFMINTAVSQPVDPESLTD